MKKILPLFLSCIFCLSFSYAPPPQASYKPAGNNDKEIIMQAGFSTLPMVSGKLPEIISGNLQGKEYAVTRFYETLNKIPFEFLKIYVPSKAIINSAKTLNTLPMALNIFYPGGWILLLLAIVTLIWFAFFHKRTRKELKALSDHYQALLEAAPTAMLIFQDYKLKYVNTAMERLTGFSREELLSMEIWELIHPQSLNDLNSEKWFFRRNDTNMRMEFQIKTKTGEVAWVDFSAQLIDYQTKPAFLATALHIDEKKQFEAKLIEAEERYSLIVLATNDGISDYAIESDSLYLSAQWKEMLGYQDSEIVDTLEGWLELIHAEDYNKALKMFKKIQAGEIPELETEYRMRCKDGTYRWIQVKLSVVFDNHSRPVRVLGTHIDITQKKITEEVLRESEQRFKSLFSQNTAVMLITNPDTGAIEEANSAACKYYGYSHQELVGMNISCINQPAENNENFRQQFLEELPENTSHQRHKLSTGIIRDVEVYNSKIEHQGRILNHSIIYDITQRKRIEIELKAAKDQAEEAVKAKSLFISSVSHEIRTPLNAIIGLADLMVTDENVSPSMEENLQSIKFSSDHLLGIINDVLDFSKLEAGKIGIDQTTFNLPKLIKDSINAIKFKADEKGINVRLRINSNVPENVHSDPSRLKQILLNLLSNSLKFTQEGHIDIYAKVIASEDKKCMVRFAVSDTGIGISESKQSAIFESFSQAETNTFRKYGGTGLGLSISKKLVELLSGEIGVKSIEGIGSTFWFEIPMQISEVIHSAEPSRPLPESKDLSFIKVLMVEDDKMNQYVLSKILKKWKINVDIAGNGKEAIEMLKKDHYNAVLMDLHMPQMDGYEASKAIRSGTSGVLNPEVPIIALTGDITKETQSIVKESGMNGYITKPCEQLVLIQMLMKYASGAAPKVVKLEKNAEYPIDRKHSRNHIKKALWDIFDDDFEATRSMIRHFIKQVPENLEQAIALLSQNQKDQACKNLHKIKPGFAYLGFPEVSELVEILQQQIRSEVDQGSIDLNIITLEQEIRKIINVLHEVHKELEPDGLN